MRKIDLDDMNIVVICNGRAYSARNLDSACDKHGRSLHGADDLCAAVLDDRWAELNGVITVKVSKGKYKALRKGVDLGVTLFGRVVGVIRK